MRRLWWLALVVCLVPAVAGHAQGRTSAGARDEILRRAQVWLPPASPLADINLEQNPPGPDTFHDDASVDCRFRPAGVGGSTPKFECELPDGGAVKVKYGRDNPEVFAEVIASRLLSALGFPADRMYVVARVRCFGCPPDPFSALQCLNDGTPKERCFPNVDYAAARTFADAVIERSVQGRRIETRRDRGWRWDELVRIDPGVGGAPRAHVDALRLMAVFLGHWDNKSKNQRLLCLDTPQPPRETEAAGEGGAAPACDRPLAMIQDLGDAFGPFKLDLDGWRASPVWADETTCRVSMRRLPYGGSTFRDVTISEDGRSFLAERLRGLTPARVRGLLTGARLARYRPKDGHRADVDAWVETFTEKIRAIVDRPPCPGL